ncbi:TetR/AcrR family transcriptional regulator [Actinoplanes aureus]|uniref:TetR/AcrR family transcriptional regulator n=1 Tax=Actinoplanes aureus TaxID=2792083 RepID=A0A931C5D0_9ACTN|nr:TetR/AcrR family transcriptional regulator [Actinoplanes aureus]MBG0563705.1 TetR/AcrR family transcriptional regulator [Actinoplanes aureus]
MKTAQPFRRDRARLPAAERRRQILEVTTGLIAERGFWGLSMQDVADGCGLTVPGLLHHVGSKDNLLVAVLEHRDEADLRSLAGELGVPADGLWTEGPSAVTLPQVCAALVRRNAGQPEIVRLFAVLEAESLAPDHPAHEYFRVRQQRILSSLAALVPAPADGRAVASQVVALMDGLQIQWLREPDTFDLAAAWDAAAARLFS